MEFSTMLRDLRWLVPTVQVIHIIAVALIIGSALVSNLRIAGVLAADLPPDMVLRRHHPWIWAALALAVLTGAILVAANSDRVIPNPIFRAKMALLAVMVLLTMLLQRIVRHPPPHRRLAGRTGPVTLLAWLSLAIWTAIIIAGHRIAYAV